MVPKTVCIDQEGWGQRCLMQQICVGSRYLDVQIWILLMTLLDVAIFDLMMLFSRMMWQFSHTDLVLGAVLLPSPKPGFCPENVISYSKTYGAPFPGT